MLPGQATSFLSSPGLFAPSFSLAIRKTPGLLAVIPSFYTSQHEAASVEKPALMIQDSDPYDRIISEEQYGQTLKVVELLLFQIYLCFLCKNPQSYIGKQTKTIKE